MTRLGRAWRALDYEHRLAAIAAVLLVLTMLLPWYQQNGVVHGIVVSRDLNAFAVFSLIEGLVLLIALGVLAMLFVVAERQELPLRGIDGTLVLGGGSFAALLLVIRLFDKPGVSGNDGAVDVGVQWGIFFALAASGLLLYAGARMRSAEREPPLLRGRRSPSGPSGGPSRGSAGYPRRRRASASRELSPPPETIDSSAAIVDTNVDAAHERWKTADDPFAAQPVEADPIAAEPIGAHDARAQRTSSRRSEASRPSQSEQLSFDDDTRP